MSALTDRVRDHLRATKLTPTAAAIAEALKASVLEVGRALDELKGLRHATEDGLHRWRITDKGRLATRSEPPAPRPRTNGATRPSPADGRSIIERIVEALGDEALTSKEIAERTGLEAGVVSQNLSASGPSRGVIKIGKRGYSAVWKRKGTGDQAVDRAALAVLHDQQEREELPARELLARADTALAAIAQPDANAVQIAGDHYQHLDPQPWDVITAWGFGFLDGNALKYLARWRHKNGLEDLRKARHYIDKLIETEEARS